ncbi:unnamed protein product [Danaus chrysippus]|uniref:(African queen) hypothetical protein n=1 Tax=Danaus chrysippus TaxID=151541 RepID=A0A8J2WAL3_9NEOP|nr:unnamed protein product [Danaus chrysippus]
MLSVQGGAPSVCGPKPEAGPRSPGVRRRATSPHYVIDIQNKHHTGTDSIHACPHCTRERSSRAGAGDTLRESSANYALSKVMLGGVTTDESSQMVSSLPTTDVQTGMTLLKLIISIIVTRTNRSTSLGVRLVETRSTDQLLTK